MDGWVKLHRKIEENPFYGNPDYMAIWLDILIHANHKDNEIFMNGKIIKVKAGQFVTSRTAISERTGVSESKTQRVLKCFENAHQIEQQTFSKYRLITVVNWLQYQGSEQENERQMNSKRTTDEQQMNTNKNDKNEKNEKNEKNKITFCFESNRWLHIKAEDMQAWSDAYPACDVQLLLNQMADWLLSNPTKRKSEYRRFITNWLKREQDKGGTAKSRQVGTFGISKITQEAFLNGD